MMVDVMTQSRAVKTKVEDKKDVARTKLRESEGALLVYRRRLLALD